MPDFGLHGVVDIEFLQSMRSLNSLLPQGQVTSHNQIHFSRHRPWRGQRFGAPALVPFTDGTAKVAAREFGISVAALVFVIRI